MSRLEEKLTEQFRAWELRGRGWQLWNEPIRPEPAFRPFTRQFVADAEPIDDGRRPTALSSLVRSLSDQLTGAHPKPPQVEVDEEDPEPRPLSRDGVVELQVSIPANLGINRDLYGYFFASLALCREPVTYEIIFGAEKVYVLFAVHPADVALLRGQLAMFFPTVVLELRERFLEGAWVRTAPYMALVECGLARECMYLLSTGKVDPYVPLIGALSDLTEDELAVMQVMFEPVRHPWAENILSSVTNGFGKEFFVNVPELTASAKQKITRPLYAVVLRLAAKATDPDRVTAILQSMVGALGVYDTMTGNALVPLHADPSIDFESDLLRRETHRSGMLLNADELVNFVHVPSSDVCSEKVRGSGGTSKSAPTIVCHGQGIVLGENRHLDVVRSVSLTPEQRTRHTHIIGASGTGKSTLLFNSIRQDIENGEGVALLDPHGDLADLVLSIVPPERVDDVVFLDPADAEHPVGFNILHAHSDLEKTLLASDLVSVFERLSQAWGDQMGSVLRNAILAFLESDRGGSLVELRRFLLEPTFRESFLLTVRDPEIVYYWKKGFTTLSGSKSIGPVLTRLETFLAPKSIRYMVGQTSNKIDFADIIDGKKIFIAKLSQGTLGRENSYLLGTLIVSKLQEFAMSRQAQKESARSDFFLYVDEFHNFITPSMAEILSGARKYHVGLVLAHQELRQLERDREVASAVLSNCHTRICFRVGDHDARALEGGFSTFTAKDLQNLGTGEAICRVERSDFDFNLTVPNPERPDEELATAWRDLVVAVSRGKYGTPRAVVEADLAGRQHLWAKEETPSRVKEERVSPSPKAGPNKAVEVPADSTVISEQPSQPVAPLDPELKTEPAPEGAHGGSPGRGGHEHKLLQALIKQWAEGMGYRATIEKGVLRGTGSVDVALEKGDRKIGCEISITTPPEQEIGNIKKCIEAGFRPACLICTDAERLLKMKRAVSKGLTKEELELTKFCTPDELFALVQEIEAKAISGEKVVKGYKVKVNYRPLDAHERHDAEQNITQAVVKKIRRRGE